MMLLIYGVIIILVVGLELIYNDAKFTDEGVRMKNTKPKVRISDSPIVETHMKKFCIHCSNFDGYDMCLLKPNFGSIDNDSVANCKTNSLFVAE